MTIHKQCNDGNFYQFCTLFSYNICKWTLKSICFHTGRPIRSSLNPTFLLVNNLFSCERIITKEDNLTWEIFIKILFLQKEFEPIALWMISLCLIDLTVIWKQFSAAEIEFMIFDLKRIWPPFEAFVSIKFKFVHI